MTASAPVDRGGVVNGQGKVGVDLAKKEPGAGAFIEQQRVLADPAETGLLRQCLLEYRGAVGKHPCDLIGFSTGSQVFVNAQLQLSEPCSQHLVVVPTQSISCNIGTVIGVKGRMHVTLPGQIVHSDRDDADRAGQQFARTAPLAAMM